jgi:hypothetical protein
MEPWMHEVKIGGFKLRYAAAPYPDIVPVTGIRAVIGNNVELVFRSKVVGRVAVVSQSGIKWYQVRPRLNSVLAPRLLGRILLSIRHGLLKARL